jgi:branched-chain amino acid transport system ATP-binding protein
MTASAGTPNPGMPNPGTPVLELNDVHTYYGQIHALKGITFKVNKGEIVCLIGGNGAGKSTTLRTISSLRAPKRGDVIYKGQKINAMPAHDVMKLGMAHVPEGRRIFPRLTVRENLEIGGFTVKSNDVVEQRIQNGYKIFPRLKEREKQLGGTLSGGEQQMLAFARALMVDPEMILLDEPSMGLSPLFVETIFDSIVELNKQGKTILLVEQNALMALGISHRGYVLQTGEIVLSGSGPELAANDEVKKKYLGDD